MSVAKAYARALQEAAVDAKVGTSELDRIESQLEEFTSSIESSKDARVVLLSPVTPAKDKAALVSQLADKAGLAPLLKNFLVLLARKERLNLLPGVRDSFAEVRLEAEGGIMGKVVSADPLDPADLQGLSKAFTQKLGKRIAFRASTDPTLLAGIKVTVNGVTYDGTLRSQLTRLRDRLVFGTGTAH